MAPTFASPLAKRFIDAGMEVYQLRTPGGASLSVSTYGAHIFSWKLPFGKEIFFVSEASKIASGFPVRGGDPVCFPLFAKGQQMGLNDPNLPQHGFVRTMVWSVDKTSIKPNEITLFVTDTPETLKIWPHKFTLTQKITLIANKLQITSSVTNNNDRKAYANPEDAKFNFQHAHHFYFRTPDHTQARIEGLKGLKYIDKVRGDEIGVEQRQLVDVINRTDRPYLNVTDWPLKLHTGEGTILMTGDVNTTNAVVWNPGVEIEATIADLKKGDHGKFVCLEAGRIVNDRLLEPEEIWRSDVILEADFPIN